MRRLFYDLETDSEHPAYANMTLCGILEESQSDIHDLVHVWEAPFTDEKLGQIQTLLCAKDVQRIGFNSLNYDDLVLHNHGVTVPEENTEDAYLAVKTCCPGLPAYGLKFLNWYLLGDPHWPEFEWIQEGNRFDTSGKLISDALRKYHRHDLYQHRNIWDWVADKVQNSRHRDAYRLDMNMKFPLQEMIFDGGVLVDVPKCKDTLATLQKKKEIIQSLTLELTKGKIKNINSNKQVGQYLANVEDFELNLTATGEFQVKKKDLSEIVGMTDEEMRAWVPGTDAPFSSVAMLAWQMKDNETLRKYVTNYLAAAEGTMPDSGWIPSSYSISRANTRRTLSKSYYKINFQNSTEEIERFKLVPPGMIGWWIDSTQVENVVHIYESGDVDRRAAYEADPEWNEYVWLCNRILGGPERTKAELDAIKSTQVPHWSVYKLYKTEKLSINFGQGPKAFCKVLKLDEKIGKKTFADIHRACPAIRSLQDRVQADLERDGYVQDTFGHVYTGEEAYKVVAYLIQGCGTGSLPKAQLRANYETLHIWSELLNTHVGVIASTTHDEQGGFLKLNLGKEVLISILEELMANMTSKFSPKFDGIPLRAKLYLSTTNYADRKNYETKQGEPINFPDGV